MGFHFVSMPYACIYVVNLKIPALSLTGNGPDKTCQIKERKLELSPVSCARLDYMMVRKWQVNGVRSQSVGTSVTGSCHRLMLVWFFPWVVVELDTCGYIGKEYPGLKPRVPYRFTADKALLCTNKYLLDGTPTEHLLKLPHCLPFFVWSISLPLNRINFQLRQSVAKYKAKSPTPGSEIIKGKIRSTNNLKIRIGEQENTAAAISFILHPDSQLTRPVSSSPAAHLVLQSLGGLLLSTNLVCLVFLARPGFDDTSRLVVASLATWHVWACRRAWLRLTMYVDEDGGGAGCEKAAGPGATSRRTFGGPAVHLGVHVVLGHREETQSKEHEHSITYIHVVWYPVPNSPGHPIFAE
ncbi:hypothetical protein ACRALDRAFT_205894 [Sodiomyces alcalophilus JCM 7366]|uniref:uncharacterized protein n=1 Tax=Sodiomyces alcalophilus JCM 7366 TaxID=591952 RepID=UPI0039B4109A